MSADRLAAIAARAEAATAGPWAHTADRQGDRVEGPDGHWLTYGDDECGPTAEPADAEFIAHARTDVPDLVAVVQAVREALNPTGDPEMMNADYHRLYCLTLLPGEMP